MHKSKQGCILDFGAFEELLTAPLPWGELMLAKMVEVLKSILVFSLRNL